MYSSRNSLNSFKRAPNCASLVPLAVPLAGEGAFGGDGDTLAGEGAFGGDGDTLAGDSLAGEGAFGGGGGGGGAFGGGALGVTRRPSTKTDVWIHHRCRGQCLVHVILLPK